MKNRCIHCHRNDADRWRRLIGQLVHAASIRVPVLAVAFTRIGRMLRGRTAGSTRRNTDRQQNCCADSLINLAESNVVADSGRGCGDILARERIRTASLSTLARMLVYKQLRSAGIEPTYADVTLLLYQ